jgi:superfamily II DNA or RNA helicase
MLQDTLTRLGAEDLAAILGEQSVRLLEQLGERNLTSYTLADLVVRQFGSEHLLLDKAKRNEILQALPRSEAERLARLLSLGEGKDPYEQITAVDFRRGTLNGNLLFTFFGCDLPEGTGGEIFEAQRAVNATYPLFDHQRRACRDAYRILTSGKPPRVFLHMPTGAGKTRTAMNVIALFLRERAADGDVVVWLAYTEELCEQSAEEFEKAWEVIGDHRINLFRNFGPYKADLDDIKGGFLIAGLKKLYQDSLSQQSKFFSLARRTPLVIMDEAHEAVAPTYRHLLSMLAPDDRTAILGLSATPGRSWRNAEEDLKLAEFFHRQKVTLTVPGYANPVDYLQSEGYLAKVEYERLPYTPGKEFELTATDREQLRDGLDLSDSAIARLGADYQRNLLILTRVMKEADKGGKILVFACSVSHANVLANLLHAKGYRAAAISSKTPPDRRRRLVAQYRDTDEVQIFTNYDVLSQGFDAPKTNAAVITRPTRSVVLYSQMVGRAARGPKAGGNETCRVLSVIDNIPGFRSIGEAFGFWEDIWAS